MSKRMRDQFEKRPRDYFDTPPNAVKPLLKVLKPGTVFTEPCAGSGALVKALEDAGHVCVEATDIEPAADGIETLNALDYEPMGTVITNPPFSREMLEPLLQHWTTVCDEAWLLVPLDLLANLWFGPYAPHVHKIVPIGRITWISGSRTSGFENYVWSKVSKTQSDVLAQRVRAA